MNLGTALTDTGIPAQVRAAGPSDLDVVKSLNVAFDLSPAAMFWSTIRCGSSRQTLRPTGCWLPTRWSAVR